MRWRGIIHAEGVWGRDWMRQAISSTPEACGVDLHRQCRAGGVCGFGGFDHSVWLCRTSSPDISVVPSTSTISAVPSGIPHCNSAGSATADEWIGRILSADSTVHAAGVLIAFAAPLDFRNGLFDSREAPCEVITTGSSCPGGDCTPLRGANLRLTAESTL
jgi:hypothetical protein